MCSHVLCPHLLIRVGLTRNECGSMACSVACFWPLRVVCLLWACWRACVLGLCYFAGRVVCCWVVLCLGMLLPPHARSLHVSTMSAGRCELDAEGVTQAVAMETTAANNNNLANQEELKLLARLEAANR